MKYTLNYLESEGQFTGYLLEIPGVITQADTFEELKENIKDALGAMLEVLKEEAEETLPIHKCWEDGKQIEIEL